MKNSKYEVGIVGLGSYVPEKILTNQDLEKIVDTNDEWITTRTGIKQRHIAGEHETTSDMAIIAAEKALKDAKMTAEDIDLIIVGTITPDMSFPATSCIVQDKLGAVNAAAFDIQAGCSGFVYALAVGTQFIQTGIYRHILIIGADALSKITNWEDRSTCVLFGDGAGAAVISRLPEGEEGILAFDLGARGSGAELLKMPAGGIRQPVTPEAIDQKLNTIHMAGNEVYKFAVRIMGEAAVSALEKAGFTHEDLDFFVPHQANIRIIKAAAKRLKIPMEKVFVNVHKYGNTSAASVPIALDEAYHQNKVKKGDLVALVGFGAGLTWAASVLKWTKEERKDV